jgi:predicted phosphoribosyltransferase
MFLFRNRADAGQRLADALRLRRFHDPLVLAIPRGGVIVGVGLARELGAELDVVLARKLRAPGQPEFALGAVAENGAIYLNPELSEVTAELEDYLASERLYQSAEIARRKVLFRSVKPAASLRGRSVLVTDDGIATGATMLAALQVARGQRPRELIVAVPVAAPDRLQEVRRHCDAVVCLAAPEWLHAVGAFYRDFTQVSDEEAVETLREFAAEAVAPTAKGFARGLPEPGRSPAAR